MIYVIYYAIIACVKSINHQGRFSLESIKNKYRMLTYELFEALNPDERNRYGQDVSQDLKFVDEALHKYYSKVVIAINKYIEGNIIWRGVTNSSLALLVDPTKVERRSANTKNYLNLLISTLPSWQNYPPRNRSLICSGSKGMAGTYSSSSSNPGAYVVLPFGDPLIGQCPQGDLWASFEAFTPPELNDELSRLWMTLTETGLPQDKEGFFAALNSLPSLIKAYLKKEPVHGLNQIQIAQILWLI